MAVPESIRKVPRPVNTVVVDNGGDGPKRYAVRERASVKYVPGGNAQPRNGRVIGHITNGVYVPIAGKTAPTEPDSLCYGPSAFVKSAVQDIQTCLMEVYPVKDVYAIMTLATLWTINPSITIDRFPVEHIRSFVRKDYPDVDMEPDAITAFLRRLGDDGGRRLAFYQKWVIQPGACQRVPLDGTLRNEVNDLPIFSYRAAFENRRDLSVIYAYDIKAMKPICAEVFPGSGIDDASCRSFIADNDIRGGVVICGQRATAGLPTKEMAERLDLHYLMALEKEDPRISDNEMDVFSSFLEDTEDEVFYKKIRVHDGCFLYSFKCIRSAADGSSDYLAFMGLSNKGRRPLKDMFVLESDLDADPKTIYLCYEDRWPQELVFRPCNDEYLERVDGGDSLEIGREFVRFIAMVATCRLITKARDAGLMKELTYEDIMDDLSTVWRMTDAPEPPRTEDGFWVCIDASVFEELEALGLSVPVQKAVPKKRGGQKKKPAEPVSKRPGKNP